MILINQINTLYIHKSKVDENILKDKCIMLLWNTSLWHKSYTRSLLWLLEIFATIESTAAVYYITVQCVVPAIQDGNYYNVCNTDIKVNMMSLFMLSYYSSAGYTFHNKISVVISVRMRVITSDDGHFEESNFVIATRILDSMWRISGTVNKNSQLYTNQLYVNQL